AAWDGGADGWFLDPLRLGPAALDERAPRAVRLAHNAPNPFNPATTIRFELSLPGRATLRILDVRARLVRVLADGPVGAGPQQVQWDGRDSRGRDAASGLYLYELRALGETRTRKMLLVR